MTEVWYADYVILAQTKKLALEAEADLSAATPVIGPAGQLARGGIQFSTSKGGALVVTGPPASVAFGFKAMKIVYDANGELVCKDPMLFDSLPTMRLPDDLNPSKDPIYHMTDLFSQDGDGFLHPLSLCSPADS